MVRHQGIILQSVSPDKNRVVLLDRLLGRIQGKIGAKKGFFELRAGLIITYFPFLEYRPSIEEIELVEIPLLCARTDFAFLHLMLELCYYFLPDLSPSPAIFDLVHFLLNSTEKLQYSVYKKIILARFFIHSGMYPEKEILSVNELQLLMQKSCDELMDTIDTTFEVRLRTWLLECIQMHPQSKKFKTLNRATL